jgi:hypothetical protein
MEEVMSRQILLCAWLCAMAFVVATNPAQATGVNQVSYVSSTGGDSNACNTPATACETFDGALAKTVSYGEIDCVSPSDYPSFTVAQSVTIDCASGIGVSLGSITINGAGIVVRLRNLSINGEGLGFYGIDAKNMAALYLENCIITNFNAAAITVPPSPYGPFLGIKFEPSANAQLLVSNSIVSDNGYSGGSSITGGIYIKPASSVTATVSINRSEINGNTFGIVADGRSGGIINGTISDSVVSGNTENGLTALSSGSSVVFMIDQTKVTGNLAAGLYTGGSNAGIVARNTTVYGNAIGLDAASGGTLYTYGNNSVNGNKTNGAFTGTVGLQ